MITGNFRLVEFKYLCCFHFTFCINKTVTYLYSASFILHFFAHPVNKASFLHSKLKRVLLACRLCLHILSFHFFPITIYLFCIHSLFFPEFKIGIVMHSYLIRVKVLNIPYKHWSLYVSYPQKRDASHIASCYLRSSAPNWRAMGMRWLVLRWHGTYLEASTNWQLG